MIIGILGLIGSGKGTVGDYLVEAHGFVRDSFASSLKDAVAAVFGWPRSLLEGDTEASRKYRERIDPWWSERLGIRDLTPRWVLQQVGSEVFRNNFHPDTWIASLEYRLAQQPNQNRVITDVRFLNEIDMIKRLGGCLIHVTRGPNPDWWADAVKYNYDIRVAKYPPDVRKPHSLRGIHESETAWVGTVPDYVLQNDGTLDQLHTNIRYALTLLRGPVIMDDQSKK